MNMITDFESPEIQELLESAIDAIQAKNWGSAEVLFEDMNKRSPENWWIFLEWGKMYRLQNELEKAEQKFSDALTYTQLPEQKAYIFIEFALLYHQDKSKAEEYFYKAEQADKKNKKLYVEWAKYYYDERQEYYKALAKISSILEDLDRTDRKAKALFDGCTRKILAPKKSEDAAMTTITDLESPEIQELLESAIDAIQAKNWRSAEILFEDMNKRSPENWRIFLEWGKMYRCKNKEDEYVKAEQKLHDALTYTQCPEQKAHIFIEYALLYQLMGQSSKAEEYFHKAEQADKKNKKLYIEWAKYYYDERQEYYEALAKISYILDKLDRNDRKAKALFDGCTKKILYPGTEKSFEDWLKILRNFYNLSSDEEDEISDDNIYKPDWTKDISWEELKKRGGNGVEGLIEEVVSNFGIIVRLSQQLSGIVPQKALAVGFEKKISVNTPVRVRILDRWKKKYQSDTLCPELRLIRCKHK